MPEGVGFLVGFSPSQRAREVANSQSGDWGLGFRSSDAFSPELAGKYSAEGSSRDPKTDRARGFGVCMGSALLQTRASIGSAHEPAQCPPPTVPHPPLGGCGKLQLGLFRFGVLNSSRTPAYTLNPES